MGITIHYYNGERETIYVKSMEINILLKYISVINAQDEQDIIDLTDAVHVICFPLSDQGRWRHGLD